MDFLEKLQRRLAESVVISPTTEYYYRRALERLACGTPRVGAKRTHFYLRSALLWFHREHIRSIAKAGGWPACTNLAELHHQLSPHLDALDVLHPLDAENAQIVDVVYSGIKSVTLGKRRGLGRLQDDWREQLLARAEANDRLPIILLVITGCRPSEVALGVDIRRQGRQVLLGIRGAKVTADNGQPYRVLSIDEDHPWGCRLVDCLSSALTHAGYWESARSLQHRIRRVATQWQHSVGISGYQISAYSFRHQVASDLKRDGESAEWIAAVLGHRSTRTAASYGTWHQGKSGQGGLIQGVAVMHAPRQWPSSFPSSPLTNHRIVIIPKFVTAESASVSQRFPSPVSGESPSRHKQGRSLS